MIDLHTHTNASDGTLTRSELLEFAAMCGASRIAITDHDTLANSFADDDDPVEVVTGIEISARDPDRGNRKVHILCYFPQKTQELEDYCEMMHERRFERGEGYYRELSELFPIITRERLEKYSAKCGVYMKQHFLDVLTDYGYTNEVYGKLYKRIFSEGLLKTPSEPDYLPVVDALGLVRGAGGVAVIAHPSVYHSMELTQLLAKARAIDGVEIDHYRNTSEDREILKKLAGENGLIVTGGSDYHARTNSGPVLVCGGTTEPDQFERIVNLAKSRRK